MARPAPSYHDYYAASPYAQYLREHRLAGAVGGMIEAAQPAGDFSDPPVAELVLIRVGRGGVRSSCDFGGGRFTERSPAGTLFLVAPETATDIVVDGPHVIRCLALPAATTRPILEPLRPGGDPFDFGQLHRGGFADPLVVALMDRLWAEAEHGDAAGRLFAEGAVAAILAALARDAGGPAEPERGRLADWQVRRTTDHMMDRLGGQVSLAELAAVAGLSPSHFCRAFRRSTGLPPHRWLTRRRVERACELLRGTQGGVADIAFASSQHMATVFRRTIGATPSTIRRDAGPQAARVPGEPSFERRRRNGHDRAAR